MHLFYTPEIEESSYTLSEDESKHCVRVLRLKEGDNIVLIDGKGGWYDAIIIEDNPKRCKVEVLSIQKEKGKVDFHLHVAIAPTKNNVRTEWFVEKATEIGISEISLLKCENSERTVVKTERLNKVAVSAMKQCLNAYLPQTNELSRFKNFVEQTNDFKGQKFIAHCEETEPLHLNQQYQKGKDVIILIGPEGDFSQNEIQLAKKYGFHEVSLGGRRLRTETAGLYTCTVINSMNI